MIPVRQRITGWPYGECVRACYASILRLPIDEVPRFDPAALGGREQIDAERSWLRALGLDLQTVPPTTAIPRVEHLMSGWSSRGLAHRCVGFGGRVLWDPHPSREGLTRIISYELLVPAVVRRET